MFLPRRVPLLNVIVMAKAQLISTLCHYAALHVNVWNLYLCLELIRQLFLVVFFLKLEIVEAHIINL